MDSIIYGPVPSRRLGHSLGVNNIPPKICSYSCVYCQIGKTMKMRIKREHFYNPEEIAGSVKDKLEQVRKKNEPVDYIAFVPDGEPTLDAKLGEEIDLIKPFGIKTAVITNGTLIWHEDVRQDLQKANWVSLKIDTVSEDIWRQIDRPQRSLELEKILSGMLKFRDIYRGKLVTESMLIKGINDSSKEFEKMATFLSRLNPDICYLAVPTRPPAKEMINAASEEALNSAYQIFADRLSNVEYLIGYEGNDFAFTGNVENDLLSITSVHPMKKEGVMELLKKAGASWDTVDKLIKEGRLIETEYEGGKFYLRKLSAGSRPL